jgi:hypothetical protein
MCTLHLIKKHLCTFQNKIVYVHVSCFVDAPTQIYMYIVDWRRGMLTIIEVYDILSSDYTILRCVPENEYRLLLYIIMTLSIGYSVLFRIKLFMYMYLVL